MNTLHHEVRVLLLHMTMLRPGMSLDLDFAQDLAIWFFDSGPEGPTVPRLVPDDWTLAFRMNSSKTWSACSVAPLASSQIRLDVLANGSTTSKHVDK